MQHQLINFLEGSGTDDRGHTIAEITNWPDGKLESCHDYIQWTFPNRHRSLFNPGAPVLDDDTISHILDCPAAINNIRRLLIRLYSFYSFEVVCFEDGTYQLDLSPGCTKPWWITPGNHNYLRLTRIMQTLKDLELEEDLFALSDILDVLARKYHHSIGQKTLSFGVTWSISHHYLKSSKNSIARLSPISVALLNQSMAVSLFLENLTLQS